MLVNYEYYKIFYYVAKYQNFTRAAVELDNNQPNISRSVKNLENTLGCVLFSRTSRGVKLTPEGETLYSHIVPAILQIEAGEKELLMQKNLKAALFQSALPKLLCLRCCFRFLICFIRSSRIFA